MMVNTRVPIAAVDSASPARSRRGASGSREVGIRSTTRTATIAATGARARKTLPHQKCSSSQPPQMGPAATPRPVMAPHAPMALARPARSVKTLAMIDSVVGKTIAAPTPIRPRTAMSSPGELAREPMTLPAPKITRPASREPLRPTRSLTLPAASTSAANTRL